MKALTVKQYMSAVRRVKACPEDMRYQVEAWPYPQGQRSHIAIWRSSWPHEVGVMPARRVTVRLTGSDIPGELMRVDTCLTPSQIVDLLR